MVNYRLQHYNFLSGIILKPSPLDTKPYVYFKVCEEQKQLEERRNKNISSFRLEKLFGNITSKSSSPVPFTPSTPNSKMEFFIQLAILAVAVANLSTGQTCCTAEFEIEAFEACMQTCMQTCREGIDVNKRCLQACFASIGIYPLLSVLSPPFPQAWILKFAA